MEARALWLRSVAISGRTVGAAGVRSSSGTDGVLRRNGRHDSTSCPNILNPTRKISWMQAGSVVAGNQMTALSPGLKLQAGLNLVVGRPAGSVQKYVTPLRFLMPLVAMAGYSIGLRVMLVARN